MKYELETSPAVEAMLSETRRAFEENMRDLEHNDNQRSNKFAIALQNAYMMGTAALCVSDGFTHDVFMKFAEVAYYTMKARLNFLLESEAGTVPRAKA